MLYQKKTKKNWKTLTAKAVKMVFRCPQSFSALSDSSINCFFFFPPFFPSSFPSLLSFPLARLLSLFSVEKLAIFSYTFCKFVVGGGGGQYYIYIKTYQSLCPFVWGPHRVRTLSAQCLHCVHLYGVHINHYVYLYGVRTGSAPCLHSVCTVSICMGSTQGPHPVRTVSALCPFVWGTYQSLCLFVWGPHRVRTLSAQCLHCVHLYGVCTGSAPCLHSVCTVSALCPIV